MSFDQLQNCPKCGKLFVKGVRDICPDCYEQVEEEYRAVAQYLRKKENRRANIYEVSEATGVSIRQIRLFIQQGRLSLADLPEMGYPCQSCSRIIREGNLCKACSKKLSRQMKKVLEEESKHKEDHRYAKRAHQFKLKDIGYLQQKKETDQQNDH